MWGTLLSLEGHQEKLLASLSQIISKVDLQAQISRQWILVVNLGSALLCELLTCWERVYLQLRLRKQVQVRSKTIHLGQRPSYVKAPCLVCLKTHSNFVGTQTEFVYVEEDELDGLVFLRAIDVLLLQGYDQVFAIIWHV